MREDSDKVIIADLKRIVKEHPNLKTVRAAYRFLELLDLNKQLYAVNWRFASSFLRRYKIDDVTYNGYPCIVTQRWHGDYFDLQTKSETEKYIIEVYLSVGGEEIREQGNDHLERDLDY